MTHLAKVADSVLGSKMRWIGVNLNVGELNASTLPPKQMASIICGKLKGHVVTLYKLTAQSPEKLIACDEIVAIDGTGLLNALGTPPNIKASIAKGHLHLGSYKCKLTEGLLDQLQVIPGFRLLETSIE